MINGYLTMAEAAARVGVDARTIGRMIAAGLEAQKVGGAGERQIGGYWLIHPDKLDAFVPVYKAQSLRGKVQVRRRVVAEQIAEMEAAGYLTAGQAARRASVDHKTVTDWIEAGELPAERDGRCYNIRIADLDAFVANWETRKLERRQERKAATAAAKPPKRLRPGRPRKAKENGNGHAHPFAPRTGNGPATWAELHPPEYRERRAPMPQAPDCCGECGRRCVTIGGKCMDCVWGLT